MLFHQRMIMLQIVDTQWKDHLFSLDHLKEGIGLRGYGQRDPLVEYKKESFSMFQALMDRIDEEILRWIFLYQPVPASEAAAEPRQPTSPQPDSARTPDGRRRPPTLHAAARRTGARAGAGRGPGPSPQPELQRSLRGALGLRPRRAARGARAAAARCRP